MGPKSGDIHWAEHKSGKADVTVILALMTEKLLEWVLLNDKKETPVAI